MNILEQIAEDTRIRVENYKKNNDIEKIKKIAYENINKDFRFEKALKKEQISFICEIKKASPSKGIIAEKFPYLEIAQEYEQANADAISVLTEPNYFKGNIKYIEEIKQKVKTPILRKDFIIDKVQIYETKLSGADAILLICSLLNEQEIKEYIEIADSLGISCLVEAHDKQEIIKAINANARIIGINNRDLKTFNVDIRNSIKLREFVPPEIIFVSESGIKTNEQIKELEKHNVNAVLIGETFMRSSDKKRELASLRGKICEN